jgi:hypothetical protein
MLPVNLLCRKHLLGEHGEIHKHLPSFRRGYSITGRFFPVIQIELSSLESRHNELAEEMIRRGYNHKSPLIDIPELEKIYPQYYDLKVDLDYNLRDLIDRCPECKERYECQQLLLLH